MFDIGFSELVLVFVIGLVVLGPKRLPVAVRTVVGWIRAMRSLASNVQNELAQELKLQELQDGLKKIEQASMDSLSPELKASVEELKQTAESMKRSYLGENEKADDEAHTIHNPLVKNSQDAHDGVTPATADHQASAPAQAPASAVQQASVPVQAPAAAVPEQTLATDATAEPLPQATPSPLAGHDTAQRPDSAVRLSKTAEVARPATPTQPSDER
ncbi:Sec-independent protein translocase subunit TatB [Erwinia sp. E602]|uniref:Sec-independent protein translocase protein TatB n=1 Tax=Erwinia sp. E602 TaxID=2675378 RepID=UPI001BAA8090|nr:Sec-independent protein translocase protein TatB [Erwinia sp. E602]QUG77552.1 Sec-independent protein translocase subunit TatB [Erwinia sp. E602]